VFATVIQANYITKKDDKLAVSALTDEDIKAIVQLSKDERIGERVSCSMLGDIFTQVSGVRFQFHKSHKQCLLLKSFVNVRGRVKCSMLDEFLLVLCVLLVIQM
jgi:hypothetical protein